jgi:hypothetical protein
VIDAVGEARQELVDGEGKQGGCFYLQKQSVQTNP